MEDKKLQAPDNTSGSELISGSDQQLSEYELHYPIFVDSKEPLKVLEEKDWTARTNAFTTHELLSQKTSPNRMDYFDIPYGDDPLQKLDIHHKKGNQLRPVIFFIHGGGWVMGDKNFSMFAAPTWVELGYTVVSVNYRLAPNFKHPTQIEDCANALQWVFDNIHKYCGNPNKIAMIGHSAGSHLAALLITDKRWQSKYNLDINKIKCWILMSGIYDLMLAENYLHPMMKGFIDAFLDSEDKKKDASPIFCASRNVPAGLVLHGGDDWLVPKSNTVNFYNKLKESGADISLEIIKNYWHSNMLMCYGDEGHETTEIVNRFLSKCFPV